MEKRNGFNSGLGFILAAAGSSVGLGNLWSFPYKTSQNGGASFVIIYVISVIILGALLCIGEIYIGRRAYANPVSAYKKINKGLGFVGLMGVFASFLIICYYIILGGYTVKYTVNSFADNTDILESYSSSIWQVILFTAIFLALGAIIISLGVKKGIEKASKILMPILVITLIGIVIYALCLGKGVGDGLNYYLNPDFKALGFKGVLAAMSQAFFSLSVGAGILAAYGSYMGKDVKIGRSVLWIAFFDTFVALLAGLAIFPAIYHYEAETGIKLQNNGIVLLFESMPIVFNKLGFAGKFVSFFFFGMVSIAALTSVISLLEGVCQFVIQFFKIKRRNAVIIVSLIALTISIPISISLGYALNGKSFLNIGNKNLLDVFDSIVNSIFIPIGALFICISIGWFMFKTNDKKELFSSRYLSDKLKDDGLNLGKFNKVFAFMIKYIIPSLIIFIEVFGIIDVVWPKINDSRMFSLDGFIVILIANLLLIGIIIVYFVFIKNKETGSNDDELENTLE